MQAPLKKMTSKLKLIHEHAEHETEKYLHQEGQLLQALIEVDKSEAYKCFGYTHLTPYCIRKLGLSECVAPIYVRIIRKSVDVPELAQAVINGELEITKAKTIAAVITKENKQEWIEKAASMTKLTLEKEVAKTSGRDTKPLTLELTFEEHEKFKRLQECLCPKLDHYPTKEEALGYMLEKTLNKIDPLRKAHRSQERSREVAGRELAGAEGPGLERPGFEEPGFEMPGFEGPANEMPAHEMTLKDQVMLRDEGKCQAIMPDGSICGQTAWTDQHHIIRRVDGGPDTLENLTTVCSSHHRAHHKAEAESVIYHVIME